jgi:hypothetical protein
MKSIVADPSLYEWEGDQPLQRPLVQTVIYELHVRGFTRHPSSGVTTPKAGMYAGLIEFLGLHSEQSSLTLQTLFGIERLLGTAEFRSAPDTVANRQVLASLERNFSSITVRHLFVGVSTDRCAKPIFSCTPIFTDVDSDCRITSSAPLGESKIRLRYSSAARTSASTLWKLLLVDGPSN